MHDICVSAGRFRPFHAGHMRVVKAALERAQYAFMVVGSCNEPINFRNPHTFEQVCMMIRGSLTEFENDRTFIFPVEDRDNDLVWVRDVQKVVTDQVKRLSLGREPDVALIGYEKDGSSYYLQMFPQWGEERVEQEVLLDATDLREALYTADDPIAYVEQVKRETGTTIYPFGTYVFLRQWVATDDFHRMRGEYLFNQSEAAKFQPNPYTGGPPIHYTADACAIQAGAVLLVRRGEMPGKGLWALPGGHVHSEWETARQAALRELVEETAFDHLEPGQQNMLGIFIRGEKLLDNPWRSTRKRTVSVAYGLLIPGTDRPFVEGRDDAHEARWWNIDEVTRSMMFEDHYNVIEDFAHRFRDIVL